MMAGKAKNQMPRGKAAFEIKEPEYSRLKPNILVIGVGGAGNNAVSNLVRDSQDGIDVLALNTDAQSLENSLAQRRHQLGPELTQGLGAGADPEVGRQAAEESREELRTYFQGYHLCFIASGMGGGTGTGASPVVAEIARAEGLLTVAIVTLPFHFEGKKKMATALMGQEALLEQVDTMIVIPNQNLFKLTNEQTSLPDAFRLADNVLCNGVRSITDLILRAGLKNLDFNDVRSVMSNQGMALIGSGTAEGETRARLAAESAINNPLLNELSVGEAQNVLINITAGYDITAFEVDEINSFIRERVHEEADVHWGANIDESMQQSLRVSVIVTGLTQKSGSNTVNSSAGPARARGYSNWQRPQQSESKGLLHPRMTETKRDTVRESMREAKSAGILSEPELAMLSGRDVVDTTTSIASHNQRNEERSEHDSLAVTHPTKKVSDVSTAEAALSPLTRRTLSQDEQDAFTEEPVASSVDNAKRLDDGDKSDVADDYEASLAHEVVEKQVNSVKASRELEDHLQPELHEVKQPVQQHMFDDLSDQAVVAEPQEDDVAATRPARTENAPAPDHQHGKESYPDEKAMLPELPDFLRDGINEDQAARLTENLTPEAPQRHHGDAETRITPVQSALMEADVSNAVAGEDKQKGRRQSGFLSLLSRKWARGPVDDEQPNVKSNHAPEPAPDVTPPKLGRSENLLYQENNDDTDEDYREIPAFLRRQVNHD